MRGTAIVIATAIYAGNRGETVMQDTEDRIYNCIQASPYFVNDEFRADVYAQLAEKLTATTPFDTAVDTIEAAMTQTAKALWGAGYHG